MSSFEYGPPCAKACSIRSATIRRCSSALGAACAEAMAGSHVASTSDVPSVRRIANATMAAPANAGADYNTRSLRVLPDGNAARPPGGGGRARRSMPVGLRAVMRERAIAERAAVALREGFDRVRRSVLQLLRSERDGVAAAIRIVVELAPGHGVIFLAHPEHA